MIKKYALLFIAIQVSVNLMAQNLTATSTNQNVATVRSAQSIIWDQPIASDGNGIVSSYFNLIPAGAGGAYTVDDFQLTQQTKIESITIYGFQNAATLESILTGLDLYIYHDASGIPGSSPSSPGTGVFEIINLPVSSPVLTVDTFGDDGYSFTFDMTTANGGDFILNAGTYWLAAAPRIDRGDTEFSYRWHWYSSDLSGNLSEAMIIDPDNLFALGSMEWIALSDLGVSFSALAFTIEGEDNLGVGHQSETQLSIYPNPTSGKIKINTPSNVRIENAILLDVLGKNTGVRLQNNEIDLSNLSKGIYMLKIQSSKGLVVKRVVRK